jgi:hypothetical protein
MHQLAGERGKFPPFGLAPDAALRVFSNRYGTVPYYRGTTAGSLKRSSKTEAPGR